MSVLMVGVGNVNASIGYEVKRKLNESGRRLRQKLKKLKNRKLKKRVRKETNKERGRGGKYCTCTCILVDQERKGNNMRSICV